MLLCISSPSQIWPLHFSNKSRQNSSSEISWAVKWISVNVNMFAVYYLSRIHQSHWYCVLIHCSFLSIIGLILRSWFTVTLPSLLITYLCCIHVRRCSVKNQGGVITPWGLDKSLVRPFHRSSRTGLPSTRPYFHVATSEMWWWSGGRGMLKRT